MKHIWLLLVSLFFVTRILASSVWVGESVTCDATSAVIGLTSDISWTTNGGYLSLNRSGFYRTVTATQYWSGTATVKCTWKYRLYSGDTWKTSSKTWTFTCKENPVSISPSEMELSVGENGYVDYSHLYSNNYISAAKVYFSSDNNNVATVTNSEQITALKEGKAYITVYSKLSNAVKAPLCKVSVKSIQVQKVVIPSSLAIEAGQTKQMSISVNPSNATITSMSWHSKDNSIVKVSETGFLTAVKHGVTSVYCLVNGLIKSNEAVITVSKPNLTLSANNNEELLMKGSTIELWASDKRSEIYYTLDGSTPSRHSTRYCTPIVIDRDLTLKAIAYHEDYNTSKILTKHTMLRH